MSELQINDYLRDQIIAHEPKLRIHQVHSHPGEEGASIFIVSFDENSRGSCTVSARLPTYLEWTDEEKKAEIDKRFKNMVEVLNNAAPVES